MKRINTPTAVGGKFVDGNGREQKATQFSAEWCNQVQEEICNLIKKWTGTEPTGLSDHELADAVAKFTQSNPLIIKTGVVQGSYHRVTIDGSSIKVERLDTNDDVHESTVIDDYTVKIRKEFADGYEDYIVGRIDGNDRGVQVSRTVTGSSGSTRTATVKNSSVTVTASGQGGFTQTKVESGLVELTNSDNDKVTIDLTDGVVNKVTGSGASERKWLELPNNLKVVGSAAVGGLAFLDGGVTVDGSSSLNGTVNLGAAASGGDAAKKTTVRGGLEVTAGGADITGNTILRGNLNVNGDVAYSSISRLCLAAGSHGGPNQTPIIIVDMNTDIRDYGYDDGSVLRVVNDSNNSITITYTGSGAGYTCAIEANSYREFIRYDGDWYKSNSLPEVN